MPKRNSAKAGMRPFYANGKNSRVDMDEGEYKSTYKSINPIQCVFEKAINSRVCNCSRSARFNLADREGVSCNLNSAQARCHEFLQTLRNRSRFALQLRSPAEPLSHNIELKIQNGGIKGVAKMVGPDAAGEQDIFALIDSALRQYAAIETLPYQDIVREISTYQVRRRRKKGG